MGRMQKALLVSMFGAALAIGQGSPREAEADDQPKPKTCATEYPQHLTSPPSSYSYDSEDVAFRELASQNRDFNLKIEKSRAIATSGPCDGIGWHTNVLARYKRSNREAFYAGSLVGCPICKDTSSGPELYEKWGIK